MTSSVAIVDGSAFVAKRISPKPTPPAASKISADGGHSTTPVRFAGSQETISITCQARVDTSYQFFFILPNKSSRAVADANIGHPHLLKMGYDGFVVHSMEVTAW